LNTFIRHLHDGAGGLFHPAFWLPRSAGAP
jgi:hypothetical protein